ncbi:MAG: hypothetical protein FJ109_05220 [Deltaproteobacteria bacterium]|nr:hypothetical protein [Deltaproteobacteria bacterium]
MKVVLDGRLYRLGAVREAAREFAGLASIRVQTGKGRISVTVEDIDPDMGPALVDEFLNFALAGTISQATAARG